MLNGSDKIKHMNERQQHHADYFLERLLFWREEKKSETTARLLAARDADEKYPLLSEEECSEVLKYLSLIEANTS